MTGGELAVAAAAAVLVFWVVGAYNRMVRLRNALVSRFAGVDELHGRRHTLIEEQLELLSAVLASAGPRLDALRAASRQADVARAHARLHPGASGAITSLRVAEEILAEARARLPVQSAAGVDLPQLNTRLAESDAALGFARREFNQAVEAYNQAIRQFPSALLAHLFGFRAAATF